MPMHGCILQICHLQFFLVFAIQRVAINSPEHCGVGIGE